MLFIPCYSWAAELSSDYNERSTIVGWRMFIGTFGNALSKFLPAIALIKKHCEIINVDGGNITSFTR